MRFVHLADIHIGSSYRGKALFDWDRFNNIIKKILDFSPDFILISGDLFDRPVVSPDDFLNIYYLLKKLQKKDIVVFTIEGNHDYNNVNLTYYDVLSKLGVINNLSSGDKIALLKEKYDSEYVNWKEINIQNKKRYFAFGEINNKKIFGMAYLRTKESINIFLPKYYREGDILMLHQSVSKISGVPEDYCEISLDELLKYKFFYFALGHIHESNFGKHLFNDKYVLYSGSLDMTSKKEFHKMKFFRNLEVKKSKKGFIFFEEKPKFVEIDSQNFFDIEIYFNSLEELKNKLEKIKEIINENKCILSLNSDRNFNMEKIKDLILTFGFDYFELKANFLEENEEELISFEENNEIELLINKFIALSHVSKDKIDLKNKVLSLMETFEERIISKNIEKNLKEENIKISEVKKTLKESEREIKNQGLLRFLKNN